MVDARERHRFALDPDVVDTFVMLESFKILRAVHQIDCLSRTPRLRNHFFGQHVDRRFV